MTATEYSNNWTITGSINDLEYKLPKTFYLIDRNTYLKRDGENLQKEYLKLIWKRDEEITTSSYVTDRWDRDIEKETGIYSCGSLYSNATYTDIDSWYSSAPNWRPVVKTPAERLRAIIQARQAPVILGRRRSLRVSDDIREVRARETLRRVLGEMSFRSFLRNGFVTVRGNSGKVYQIFPGHDMTAVWQNGRIVEKLCVVLQGRFPPTDSLIMRYLLILNNEDEFRGYAHVWEASKPLDHASTSGLDQQSLPEIFAGLKAVA